MSAHLRVAAVAAATLLAAACGPSYPLRNIGTGPSASPPATPTAPSTTAAAPDRVTPSCTVTAGKADLRCTPGALNPLVRQDTIAETICSIGWSGSVRPPAWFTNRIKAERMRAYGVTAPPSTVELDHLVPIELGGWPGDRDNPADPRNDAQLWPEPWNGPDGAHAKDQEENALHQAVCSGRMTLDVARQKIVKDWAQ